VVHETANSALIDGSGNLAYATSVIAIDKAIALCGKSGMAVVTVNHTWYSGRLAYYLERAARAGFVAMHAIQGRARTAPFGGMQPLMGTSPVAFAFPSDDEPVLIDLSLAAATHGGTNLAKAKGETLPEGVAIDSRGYPTVDPEAALNGAFLTWGAHRGSGMAMAVHMLGMLAGTAPVIESDSDFGLFFWVMDPEWVAPGGQYRQRVSEFKKIVRASPPAPGVERVRMPGDNSQANRRRATEAGANARVRVDDRIYARILELLQ
jgi:LDH2 family malate/lactate/ureidoglycolate dehydrogenase